MCSRDPCPFPETSQAERSSPAVPGRAAGGPGERSSTWGWKKPTGTPEYFPRREHQAALQENKPQISESLGLRCREGLCLPSPGTDLSPAVAQSSTEALLAPRVPPSCGAVPAVPFSPGKEEGCCGCVLMLVPSSPRR